jgi:hypothetical protein
MLDHRERLRDALQARRLVERLVRGRYRGVERGENETGGIWGRRDRGDFRRHWLSRLSTLRRFEFLEVRSTVLANFLLGRRTTGLYMRLVPLVRRP